MKKSEFLELVNQIAPSARREKLNGADHLVVDSVIAKVGVMNDNYYSKQELSEFANAWNGVPVPVGHPVENGKQVSANSPAIEERSNIGKFYNARFVDDSLKGEIWIDTNKAEKLGYKAIVDFLEGGNPIDVSTGLFAVRNSKSGTFDGKTYTHEVSRLRPDHVALLPNEQGACSLCDGCGALVNSEGGCSCERPEVKTSSLERLVNTLTEAIGIFSKNQGNDDMDKKKIVEKIIASESNQYGEAHRENLMGLDETLLTNMLPAEAKPVDDNETAKDDNPEANKQETPAVNLTNDQLAFLNRLMDAEKGKREQMEKVVLANKSLGLNEAQVKAMEQGTLETLAKTSPQYRSVDFSANAGGTIDNNDEGEWPKTPSIFLAVNNELDADDKGDKANEKEAS